MATASISSTADECEYCVLCLDKHNRARPSFCQCKHCSIPLCLDCTKEHHDELLQDVAQISHQYNELQRLVQSKQMMIEEETTKSIADVNRYFETYIDELRATQNKIIADMERSKQSAQDHVSKIDADLRLIGGEIQGLAKESVVQTAKMKTVSEELKKIEQPLGPYQIIRTENLINTQPDLSIRFGCPSVEITTEHSVETEINETCKRDSQEATSKTGTIHMACQPIIIQEYPINRPRKNDLYQDEDTNYSNSVDNDNSSSNASHRDASYNVDCMASDGENILYTTYYDEGSDRIAYCLMDNDGGDADEYRDWKQTRIQDMMWWDSIKRFVCATYNGIYTVDHTDRRFKITGVIHDKWSYARVAANTNHLFLWTNCTENDFDGIEIYSTEFEFVRAIDFDTDGIGSFVDNNSSFCVTDDLIASICTRTSNNQQVFQITFCDLNMNKLNSVLLGQYHDDIEIRTDGNNRFYITTGKRRFYVVYSDGEKQIINLENDGNYIAVLNGQRVAISCRCTSMEILALNNLR